MLTGKEAGCVPVSTRDGKYRSGMQGFFAEKSIYLQGASGNFCFQQCWDDRIVAGWSCRCLCSVFLPDGQAGC